MKKSIKIIIHTDKIPEVVKKITERKKSINAYYSGKKTLEQLNNEGIKFVMPISI